jgi:hypothetical protein
VYVSRVRLVRQWNDLVGRLPAGWVDAQVRFHPRDASQLDRAATLLGPLGATRSAGSSLTFRVASDGSGPSAAMAERLFDRVGLEKIAGTIELASASAAASAPEPAAPAAPTAPAAESLPASWDAALATLPADWSDLLGEIELGSSDYLERAALHLSPVNPRRDGARFALRFRCARTAGYGASPGMVRRCLERCDEQGIVGTASVLRVLSDTQPVLTQGPVWQISGQTV